MFFISPENQMIRKAKRRRAECRKTQRTVQNTQMSPGCFWACREPDAVGFGPELQQKCRIEQTVAFKRKALHGFRGTVNRNEHGLSRGGEWGMFLSRLIKDFWAKCAATWPPGVLWICEMEPLTLHFVCSALGVWGHKSICAPPLQSLFLSLL